MSRKSALIQLIFVLCLSLVVVASAEDLSHLGIYGGGGRSFVNPNLNGSLGSVNSACAVGRPGIGGIYNGNFGGAGAPGQSNTGFAGSNGIIQASVPEGAPGSSSVVSPGAGAATGGASNGAALFASKCASCHRPGSNLPAITAAKGSTRVADKSMPPPGSPQAQGLSDADRSAIAAFLPSLGR